MSTPRPGRDAQFRGSQVPNHGRIVSSRSPRHMADLLERVRASLAGRYTIERELGRGGMATVYLAEDLKHHRKVAVKVLKPELAATLGEERFFREIHVAAQLQHPHILPLLDSGEADGFFYYVMPYVEGESLRERLARHGELPVHYAVGVLAYELLTGRPPFVGLTPQEVLAAHVTQAPEPVERHRPALTPALSQVVMRCIAKRAADRWQTAEELLTQLEPLTTPSGGTTPTSTQPIPAPAARANWARAAAAVGILA